TKLGATFQFRSVFADDFRTSSATLTCAKSGTATRRHARERIIHLPHSEMQVPVRCHRYLRGTYNQVVLALRCYTLNPVLCVNLTSPLLTPIRPKSRLDLSQKSNLRDRKSTRL